MKTIVSMRVHCTDCDNETVIRRDQVERSNWVVNSLYSHTGQCPKCNDKLVVRRDTQIRETKLQELPGIGPTVEQNLNDELGIENLDDARSFSEEELREVDGVGDRVIKSIRNG